MKKNAYLIMLLFLFSALNLSAQDKFANWPALGDFHKVMSATFHPAEDGNLEPLKARSAELAVKAASLSKSTVPAEFNKATLKKAVVQLASESRNLDKLVKKKSSDKVLQQQLIAVHDRFHEIVGLCKEEAH